MIKSTRIIKKLQELCKRFNSNTSKHNQCSIHPKPYTSCLATNVWKNITNIIHGKHKKHKQDDTNVPEMNWAVRILLLDDQNLHNGLLFFVLGWKFDNMGL